MIERLQLPRILIIDDLFGRIHPVWRNEERANFCGQYLIEDVTGDESSIQTRQTIKKPIAEAVFYRGQKPIHSTLGEVIENNFEGTIRTIREGWDNPESGKPPWALVLLDLCFYTGLVTEKSEREKGLGMPEGRAEDDNPRQYFGLRILEAIKREFPGLPVIILSSKPRDEVSFEFTYKGALGFLAIGHEASPQLLQNYLWKYGLIPDFSGEIFGYSKALLLALRMARDRASTRQNLLIRGERGTGKELLARYICCQTDSSQNSPFVEINCSYLTGELFASELFGYEKGAFTGASQTKKGLFEVADGGTAFLDEIGDMLPQVQAGILRVLQERMIYPVGGKKPRQIDVRFLSATNKEIEALTISGDFRPDLADRLREGGTVYLPPLRERKEDISLLVEKFVREAEKKTGAMKREILPETIAKLISYDWPGNVRELYNGVFNAIQEYRDVENFVPRHIQFPVDQPSQDRDVFSTQTAIALTHESDSAQFSQIKKISFDEIIRLLEKYKFHQDYDSLSGKLPIIRKAFAIFLKNYLKAGLLYRREPNSNEGDVRINITGAIKTMTARKLTTSQAADVIKWALQIDKEVMEEIKGDEVLWPIYEYAKKRRNPKKR